jgi:L-seryl-tRNA(Ser) seleniumtransferase
MEAAGCLLREVGTTNRTYLDDYRRAAGPDTGAILRVHPSNFRIDGFVHRPPTAGIAEVARAAQVPFVDDIGSGLLQAHAAARDEPVAADAVTDGADVVIFSGDKLLGGPQAGALVGRHDLIDRFRRAPLARALRLDKLRLAALEATLQAYERDARDELPVWAMAMVDTDALRRRAERLAEACGGEAITTDAVLGGGSTPGGRLPSWGVALPGPADPLAQRLRTGEPPVVTRIVDDRVVADLRSVPADLDEDLGRQLRAATDATTGTA